jgi:hypothetical protein
MNSELNVLVTVGKLPLVAVYSERTVFARETTAYNIVMIHYGL